MTVANNYEPVKYNGNGVTTEFTVDWRLESGDDFVVYQNIDGAESVVDPDDYTAFVKGEYYTDPENPGNTIQHAYSGVIFNTAPANGTIIVLTRLTPQEQDTPYKTSSGFPADRLEDDFDELTMMVQEMQQDMDRAVKVNVTSNIDPETLVNEVERIYISIDNVDAVADIASDVSAVAGISSDVSTVAGISSDVSTVAGISSDITSVAGNATNIDTVATNISNVNAVGGNISNVNAVANNATNINAVNANKTNIDTVAGISSDVTTVAGISSDVTTVASNILSVNHVSLNINSINNVSNNMSDVGYVSQGMSQIVIVAGNINYIGTVAVNISEVNTVASNISYIQSVYYNLSNINAVAGNETNINSVAGNATNINTVAGDSAEINAVANDLTNINAVANNETDIDTVAGISTDVSTVAGISSNISTVSSVSSDVSAVASDLTNINSVASDLTNINAVAADLTNIDNASVYAAESKQWAIGDPTEPSGGSAKYWAGQAAQGQVQSDWTEADSTSKAYIKNKPTFGTGIDMTDNVISVTNPTLINRATGTSSLTIGTEAPIATSPNALNIGGTSLASAQGCIALMGYAFTWGATAIGYGARAYGYRSIALGSGAQIDSSISDSTIQIGYGTNSEAKTFYVGFYQSGQNLNYKLLDGTTGYIPNARINMDSSPTSASTNTVTSGGVYTALSGKADTSSLATVATSGSYNDLINKPSIPAAQVNSDWNAVSGVAEILNKPTIPTVDQTYDGTSVNAQSGIAVASAIDTMLATLYPVGSIYIGTQSTCPLATLISGSTWTKVSEGRVLQGSDSGNSAGTTIAAGLPNIYGQIGFGNINGVSYSTAVTTASDAFYSDVEGLVANVGVSSVSGQKQLANLDASYVNSIYGNSNTVQPPAYVVNIWERTA